MNTALSWLLLFLLFQTTTGNGKQSKHISGKYILDSGNQVELDWIGQFSIYFPKKILIYSLQCVAGH